jgi:Sep-tRNA:Cys-tRNA synthetase
MISNKYKGLIVVNALMRGGIIPPDVREKLFEEWAEVGYTVCYDCLDGRSSLISNPPIKRFLAEVASFFGGDVAEHTFGCRGAQFSVMKVAAELAREGEHCTTIVADPLSHYTTNVAAETNALEVAEPKHSGYPEYKVDASSFADKIEEVKREKGKLPALVVATHADPYYGNISPVNEIGKICEEYEVPYMVNAAYTGGVMPINMREMKADFLTLSAHKSMASFAPLGFLITNYEWSKKVFAISKQRPEWSGRVFGKKIPNIFGCSVGGLPLISSMMSFPYVKERVKKWDSEIRKINWFISEMEDIGEMMALGERPHRHHLLHFETPVFWEISKTHKRKGFFLAEEMIKRGIVGLHRGLSKHIKISVYGLSEGEIKKVLDAFRDIASGRI